MKYEIRSPTFTPAFNAGEPGNTLRTSTPGRRSLPNQTPSHGFPVFRGRGFGLVSLTRGRGAGRVRATGVVSAAWSGAARLAAGRSAVRGGGAFEATQPPIRKTAQKNDKRIATPKKPTSYVADAPYPVKRPTRGSRALDPGLLVLLLLLLLVLLFALVLGLLVTLGLLDLGPGIAQGDRAVEHDAIGRGVLGVDAEVAEPLELEPVPGLFVP